MPSKDAASSFGKIGLLLPFTLIFLIAADSAFACPQHTSRVVYPTRTTNSRTVARIAPVVIAYQGPASYQGCGNSQYNTRVVRYVPRGNGYSYGTRYVAVRSRDDYYPAIQRRYVAVRNVDYDDAPRYVAVRRVPRYAEPDIQYVVVRNTPVRTRYVAVRNINMDDYDAPRYVAERKYPVYDDTSTRYVAVRSVDTGCSRAVAFRGCLDQVETASVRHVVVRTDNLTGTTDVIVPDTNDNTAEYVSLPRENGNMPRGVEYTDAAYLSGSGERFVAVRENADPYMRTVAARTYPEAATTGTISYVPVTDDEDLNDQAILDEGGTKYVAADDVGDACLCRTSYRASPMTMDTRAVSYVPAEDVDDVAFQGGSGTTFIAADNAASAVRYVPVVDDEHVADSDTMYVQAGNVRYVDAKNVSYVRAESVSYLPAETVSYVPADSVEYVEAADVADDSCPDAANSIGAEPIYLDDSD